MNKRINASLNLVRRKNHNKREKNPTSRPQQHSKKHKQKMAKPANKLNVAKKIIKCKKNTGGKGKDQAIMLVSRKRKKNSLIGATKVPIHANKHSQNCNT